MTAPGEAYLGARPPRRGIHYNTGFLTQARVRRILQLSGYELRLGQTTAKPGPEDDVLVWGHSPYAARGEAAAEASGAQLVRVEDPALRSLHPGRSGDPPLGLVIDRKGIYFDASQPSDLEDILANTPLDNAALLDRARDAMARMADAHLTKYSAVDPTLEPPEPGYVLLIDQTKGDASIKLGGADSNSFAEMLAWAQEDHPDAELIIKAHPETTAGHRPGHFDPATLPPRASLITSPISPWRLFEGARAVYCVTSQLGFEAILAGHKPVCFGTPFYAGWGLTDDRRPTPARRQRRLTRAQLAAATLLLYPVWYDPYRDTLCPLEDVLGTLEAEARAWREDRAGHTALGMRSWKRGHMQAFFGRHGKLEFAKDTETALQAQRPVMVWAGKETDALRKACESAGQPLARVEDGLLRSRGLGAELVPPLSLVLDRIGIYYDPTRPSALEDLIAKRARMSPERLHRAETLIDTITNRGLTKYNLDGAEIDLSAAEERSILLVPGQVEDDASIRLGTRDVATNEELLRTARRLHPQAWLIYKPHPDVMAGLREGHVPSDILVEMADQVVSDADTGQLLAHVDRVVTMTSTLGFEAILRGVPVTTLGAPFYAGWGLTQDLGPVPARRQARPNRAALAHAVLIDYPRYHDPLTNRPCPPEVAVDRLATGAGLTGKRRLRALAKLQGLLSGYAHLWRR